MTPEQLAQSIKDGCDAIAQEIDDDQLRKFVELLTELERWGAKVNLTAIRDIREMVGAHLLDSLAVGPFLRGNSAIDIGTGAGFPGLPLAIAHPRRSFALLDSNGKKINFVRHIVSRLGLGNVTAIKSRAQDYAPGHTFDTVIARALARIPKIIELGGHLAGEKSVLLALKGRYPAEELEQTKTMPEHWDFSVEKISIPGLENHSRHIVSLERRAQ